MSNSNERTALIETSTGFVRNTTGNKARNKPYSAKIISITGASLIAIVIVICISLELKHDHNNSNNRYYPYESETAKQFSKIANREVKHNLNSLRTYADPGCEATVLIVRPCEKQKLMDSSKSSQSQSQEHCNNIGLQRSRYLATLFGNKTEERWPSPSYLYALSSDMMDSIVLRQIETLGPLSDKIKVPIVSDYGPLDTHKLATKLFSSMRRGEMCNQVVVACGNHRDIPNLAQKLGCGPYNGCPMKYHSVRHDDVWEINFIYRPLHHIEATNATDKKLSSITVDIDKMDIDKGWQVFGSVVKEGFDPLQFTKIENNNEL